MPTLQPTSALTRSLLAPNPGPMTLDGTNSYLIGVFDAALPTEGTAPTDGVVVVDPGPLDEAHLAALAAHDVRLVLITHRHADHTEGAARLHALTGAPVRAGDPAHCHGGAPLQPGRLRVAGVTIEVVAAPGHTDDSLAFVLPDDGPRGAVLTGDTVLGRGTTVIAHPDGDLGDYLHTLDVLERLGPATVLPAHGPVLPALDAVVRAYRAHRFERLDQLRAALDELGAAAHVVTDAAADPLVGRLVDRVYADSPTAVRPAAERSVAAQLGYLAGLPA